MTDNHLKHPLSGAHSFEAEQKPMVSVERVLLEELSRTFLWYAATIPRVEWRGTIQDPMGAHVAKERLDAALAAAPTESALCPSPDNDAATANAMPTPETADGSDTPRTDELLADIWEKGRRTADTIILARQLERELSAALRENAGMQHDIDRMLESVRLEHDACNKAEEELAAIKEAAGKELPAEPHGLHIRTGVVSMDYFTVQNYTIALRSCAISQIASLKAQNTAFFNTAELYQTEAGELKSQLSARDAELAAKSEEVVQAQRWILNRCVGLPDHACAQCVPHSDMLVSGFVCAYHQAADTARLSTGKDG